LCIKDMCRACRCVASIYWSVTILRSCLCSNSLGRFRRGFLTVVMISLFRSSNCCHSNPLRLGFLLTSWLPCLPFCLAVL
jgi:hypothetical protein